MGMDGGCQQKLRGHTTTLRSEAAALARRRWAVGVWGARACADGSKWDSKHPVVLTGERTDWPAREWGWEYWERTTATST